MNTRSRLHEQKWRALYYQYQNSTVFVLLTFVVIIFICFILVLKFIIPRIHDYVSIQKEISRTQDQIQTVQKNTTLLRQLNDDVVGSQFQTAVRSLPTDKNFTDIIGAITASSVRAGVSLDDFSFSLVDTNSVTGNGNRGVANVQLALSVNGSLSDSQRFITEIQEKLPLAEVVSVTGQGNTSSVTVDFYYKNFPKVPYNDTEPLQTISQKHATLLSTLSQWGENSNVGNGVISQSASSAANPSSPF